MSFELENVLDSSRKHVAAALPQRCVNTRKKRLLDLYQQGEKKKPPPLALVAAARVTYMLRVVLFSCCSFLTAALSHPFHRHRASYSFAAALIECTFYCYCAPALLLRSRCLQLMVLVQLYRGYTRLLVLPLLLQQQQLLLPVLLLLL